MIDVSLGRTTQLDPKVHSAADAFAHVAQVLVENGIDDCVMLGGAFTWMGRLLANIKPELREQILADILAVANSLTASRQQANDAALAAAVPANQVPT